MTALLAGLTLGIASGAHCAAMCGPFIAAMAPRGARAILHHMGRALTYVSLGGLAGVAGAGAFAAGLGRWVAWLAAAYLVVLAVFPIPARAARGRSGFVRLVSGLVFQVRRWASLHPTAGAIALGALNGLLPCGLTVAATVAAAGTGSMASGLSLMTGFAAGTTAVLAATGVVWARVAQRLPVRGRLAPLAFALVAVLLAWRGWSAGASMHVH